MNDTISRQVAIDALGEEPLVWYDGEDELAERNQWRRDVDAIKAVPPAQPETEERTAESAQNVSDDELISRKAAIDAIFSEPLYESGMKKRDADVVVPAIYEKIKSLPSAQSEQRWIPCSEKMPEYDKPVLLSTAWVKTEIGFWTQRGWMIVACSYREFEQDAVAAWMPLPEPYREGEQDE